MRGNFHIYFFIFDYRFINLHCNFVFAIWITHHSLSCCTLVLTVLSAKTALAEEEAIAEYFSLVLCGVTLFCLRAEEQQGMSGRRIKEVMSCIFHRWTSTSCLIAQIAITAYLDVFFYNYVASYNITYIKQGVSHNGCILTRTGNSVGFGLH